MVGPWISCGLLDAKNGPDSDAEAGPFFYWIKSPVLLSLVAPAAAARLRAVCVAVVTWLQAIAVGAIDRLVPAGLEGHLRVLAALGADCRVHLTLAVTRGAAVSATAALAGRLPRCSAIGATTRGGKALGLEEFLFAFGELELRAAVRAGKGLICHVSLANSSK
jgi:hypothetical protein